MSVHFSPSFGRQSLSRCQPASQSKSFRLLRERTACLSLFILGVETDKLPVRDEYDNKRRELEEQLSKLLGGEPWKLEVNQNLVFAYAEEGSYAFSSLGGCIFA